MTSRRELLGATAFFALLAGLLVGFARPLDAVEWFCLATSLGFVGLGCVALLKRWPTGRPGGPGFGARATAAPLAAAGVADESFGEPTAEERHALETTIAALEEAGALDPGEMDAERMWQAAQRHDPGQPVGVYEALASLAVLRDHDRGALARLTVVPIHVEYDGDLLAAITASILASLGHRMDPSALRVTLPRERGEGPARIGFAIAGRRESVACRYRPKDPPPDLVAALARFSRADDPRDLACADSGDQRLLIAAIRPGALAGLNRRLAAGHDVFGLP